MPVIQVSNTEASMSGTQQHTQIEAQERGSLAHRLGRISTAHGQRPRVNTDVVNADGATFVAVVEPRSVGAH